MSALLMAIAINGMTAEEMATLTQAMLRSGEQWHLRDSYDFIADKHSTGGVGDKVSLVLSPWVAACGVQIGMLSGRGLGHTGGTLDKLEAIPGFNARLSREEFERCVADAGCVHLDVDGRHRAGGQEDLRAARRHRHGRVAAAHHGLDHVEEAGHGRVGPDPRREDRQRRVHAHLPGLEGAGAEPHRRGRRLGHEGRSADHGHGSSARRRRRQRERDHRDDRVSEGQRSGGRDGSDARAGRAGAGDVAAASTRRPRTRALEEALRSGAALEQARKWIAAQGGDPAIVDDYSLLAAADARRSK